MKSRLNLAQMYKKLPYVVLSPESCTLSINVPPTTRPPCCQRFSRMKLIPIVLACVVGVAAAAPSCDCIDNKSKPPKACPYPPYPPPPPPHGKPPPPPPPRPVCEEENPPRDPLPPPSLNGKCTPATYSCAANPKTGEAGWQLCNTSGQYEVRPLEHTLLPM